ncbi:MAG: exodeoxyribonuclease III [Eubacteriales bacterium]|nr:exodeoxyribonuclease III [Eubacteriales bacterium]
MKIVSWNVNGLRACMGKGFEESMAALDPDIICLQETKLQQEQFPGAPEGYRVFLNCADKKGYSGTAIYTKAEPLQVRYGIGIDEHDHEGRVILAEYEDFQLVCCYTPNAQRELTRLEYRMQWEDDFRAWLAQLDQTKPVVLCGDLNVAHTEIDLKNPKTNHKNAGFTDEERGKFTDLLAAGFADSWRRQHPDVTGVYSWWSFMRNARATNAGWRIDYFVVSERLMERVTKTDIHCDIFGSDHCPVSIELG